MPRGDDPDRIPATIDARLTALVAELRAERVPVGTSELLDALAALGQIPWGDRASVTEALASTLAKSPADRRVLEALLDRTLLREVEAEGWRRAAHGAGEQADPEGDCSTAAAAGDGLVSEDLDAPSPQPELDIDPDSLRARIAEAIGTGDEAAMRDLARLAIARFGRDRGDPGLPGVLLGRIRRALGLRTAGSGGMSGVPTDGGLPRTAPPDEGVRRFEELLREQLERERIASTGTLPPARALTELDRGLTAGAPGDMADVQRVVRAMRRQLATAGSRRGGTREDRRIDVRRTLRASLGSGGVPVQLVHRPRRPQRPELYVLCDVSTSVTSSSTFFLAVLHALHDAFRRMRAWVFVERVDEVTEVLERERDPETAARLIADRAGVADVSGFTDLGRVWTEFLALAGDALDPRSTVIVLSDARTNGRDPAAGAFRAITERAGRTFWLNPEPRLFWNYGDSAMDAYAGSCDVFEAATVEGLEVWVRELVRRPHGGSGR